MKVIVIKYSAYVTQVHHRKPPILDTSTHHRKHPILDTIIILIFTGCPLVQATLTSLCNESTISNIEFSTPAREYLPGEYLLALCDGVSDVTVTAEGYDNTTITVPDSLPKTLNIDMNCTGVL